MILSNITPEVLAALIRSAKREVLIAFPALLPEWADWCNKDLIDRGVRVILCIANEEQAVRNGYGNIETIERLLALGVEVRQLPSLKVGFLGVDDVAYALFFESRIFVKKPGGYNAIRMNDEQAAEIRRTLFPEPQEVLNPDELGGDAEADKSHLTDTLSHATSPDEIAEALDEIKVQSAPLDKEKYAIVKKRLEMNPPDLPDLSRKVRVYTTLFQFVELRFNGSQTDKLKISIPPSALPIISDAIKEKINTRLDLFTAEARSDFKELVELRNRIKELREGYLTTISLRKDKSIIRRDRRKEFVDLLKQLEPDISAYRNILYERIEEGKRSLRILIKDELIRFFRDNTAELKLPDGVKATETIILNRAEMIAGNLDFEDTQKIVREVGLEFHAYDLTAEDLNDDRIGLWFEQSGLLSTEDQQIANYSEAFENIK
jgi:hypothetical protein